MPFQRKPSARSGLSLTARSPTAPQGVPLIRPGIGNGMTTALVQHLASERVMGRADDEAATGGGEAATPSQHKTIAEGSTGETVKLLQMKLRVVRERSNDRDALGEARIDGIFGPQTRLDVIAFQTETGLVADGVVGGRTWNAIESLVPQPMNEAFERMSSTIFTTSKALMSAGAYGEAVSLLTILTTMAPIEPDRAADVFWRIGVCHHQRGGFGVAVQTYERALSGRFNQEVIRGLILASLLRARQGLFLDTFPVKAEALPPGAPATDAQGGGVKARTVVKEGDRSEDADLFKGKLAHLNVGWKPALDKSDAFDPTTTDRVRLFQKACGLEITGEGDLATWHALDSFTKTDVPFSQVNPLFEDARAAQQLLRANPAAALATFQRLSDRADTLELDQIVIRFEADIAEAHHRLSDFPEAVGHYTAFLKQLFPFPDVLSDYLEKLRLANRGETLS